MKALERLIIGDIKHIFLATTFTTALLPEGFMFQMPRPLLLFLLFLLLNTLLSSPSSPRKRQHLKVTSFAPKGTIELLPG